MPHPKKLPLLLIGLTSLQTASATFADTPSFSKDIRPLLSDRCFACHGPDDKNSKGGLRLDLPEAALAGGKSGDPAITPGKISESEILRRMKSTDPDEVMPPPSLKKALSPEQIKLFEDWVAAGAKYEKHWAFEAPVLPAVPAPAQPAWPVRNEIDAFVQPALIQAGLTPAAEADRTTLFRRVSFDLTGLPPIPEQTAAFHADASPQAFENAVDRLLASPHYGEKWGRKWLDLARYADTNGYEKDRPRTIWPWRDWVVRSLNADMPFDQFSIEQIAGDLLPNPTTDQLIATGFHRNSMQNEEGGIDPLEFRYYAMVDRVHTTSSTWLGLTLQCAQCHTHKYDPVTHKEYFSIMAFLNNADEPELNLPDPAFEKQEKERASRLETLLGDLPAKWLEQQSRPENIAWLKPGAITVEPNPEDPSTALPEQFVFAAPGPDKTKVTLRLTGLPENTTHLRLEALTGDDLPAKGPGRTPHGNFVLSEIQVRSNGVPIPLTPISASAEQKGYPLADAVDGNLATGWAVDEGKGELNQPQSAVFALAEPLPRGAGLTVTLEQQFGSHHTIGRLKLVVGTAPAVAAPEPGAFAKAVDAWAAAQKSRTADWKAIAPVTATSNSPNLNIQPDATVFVSGDTTKADTYQLQFAGLPDNITALRLEALPDPRLPAHGPGMTYYEGPKGEFFMGEFQLATGGQPVKFSGATESYAKNSFGPAATALLAIDGNPETGWTCAEGQSRAHEAVFNLAQPLRLVEGKANLTLVFGRHFASSLGKFRVSFTTSAGDIKASVLPADLQALLVDNQMADPANRRRLEREFLLQAPELAEARKEIDQLRQPATGLTTLVMTERPEANRRLTPMYNRGEFTQPMDPVSPGVLSVLNPLPPGAPADRLSFARWLVSRDQPLTARVVVNRAWAAFFGRGLVKTQEDFGYQGELPSHPALLDSLAVRFMEDGWSMKKLHRRIVLSHAYRQSSSDQPAAALADPENKWLWRGPRLRLDAEEVRDAALQAAGLLSDKMFGPGVYPPQPASITTEGAYGSLPWKTSSGEDRYRRSLYTFAKRTAPFAFTATFDAPAGDACIVRRDRSNTPLQALSLLNDVTIMEAAAAFGKTLAARPGPPAKTLTFAFQNCFSRAPDPDETAMLLAFFEKQLAAFQANPESAKELAGKEANPAIAAWTLVGRTLFNLDEFITKS